MRFAIDSLVAGLLAGSAIANTVPLDARAKAATDLITAISEMGLQPPPVVQPPGGGIPDDWPGPWWPNGNPFHNGLDYQGVCWYWTNIAATFTDMTSASYEADASNTVYWANHRGPWKFIERGYYLIAQALMTFEAQLLMTNEFRQPGDQQNILDCHQQAVTSIAGQVAVLLQRNTLLNAQGEPYIPIAMCLSQRSFTLAYLTLANTLANHLDDATLRTQFQTVAGAVWTNPAGQAASTLIGTLYNSLLVWCLPGTP